MDEQPTTSARRDELLERSYRYVLATGLSDLSLRPLAVAVGSSPRVLLFLFGSKENLIREVLRCARRDEVALLEDARQRFGRDFAASARSTWEWLIDPDHRALLVLWLEVYARSVADPGGPWGDFARQTVDDWLDLLSSAQHRPNSRRRVTERTIGLAVLRGALLDLLATGDTERVAAAMDVYLRSLREPSR